MTEVHRLLHDLPASEVTQRLRGQGLRLRISPFVVCIRSRFPVVAEGLRRLYGGHTCLDDVDGFSDFHVEVQPRFGMLKSLCVFSLDGAEPFTPLAAGEAFAFLEWGLNWCVTNHCHQWISVHAAVLERDGRAVLLPAPPGSGKSTLCAAMMLDGWRLLSDEMALVNPSDLNITPSPRPVSLKNRSIDVMRARAPGVEFGPVAKDTLKGTVCHMAVSAASLAGANEEAKPGWVVFPRYQVGAGMVPLPRGKASALVELLNNSFNHHVHGKRGFDALSRLIDQSQVYDLRYDDMESALAWMRQLCRPSSIPSIA